MAISTTIKTRRIMILDAGSLFSFISTISLCYKTLLNYGITSQEIETSISLYTVTKQYRFEVP